MLRAVVGVGMEFAVVMRVQHEPKYIFGLRVVWLWPVWHIERSHEQATQTLYRPIAGHAHQM